MKLLNLNFVTFLIFNAMVLIDSLIYLFCERRMRSLIKKWMYNRCHHTFGTQERRPSEVTELRQHDDRRPSEESKRRPSGDDVDNVVSGVVETPGGVKEVPVSLKGKVLKGATEWLP